MNPGRYDVWDVHQAAGGLQGFAHGLGARHLGHGIFGVQFTREVSYYAKHIVDDVEHGHKTPEQGIEALLEEHYSLERQSKAIMRNRQSAISETTKRIPKVRLTQPVMQPDPERLSRFVFAQHLEVTGEKTPATTHVPLPTETYKRYALFGPELWPAAVEQHDPGFYIVPKSTTVEELQQQLFTSPGSAIIAKFRALNPGLNQVKAGQMIVLSDPGSYRCSVEEARLMQAAETVNRALAELSPEEADFMVRHREEIESFISYGSTGTSIAAALYESNLNNVERVLKAIEELHTESFAKHGHLRAPEFFAKRKELFAQLDTHLTKLTKITIDYPDHPKLKTALGISSRSLVHRWGRAGGYQMNPGYATHIDKVAKAAKYIKYGGWVGTAIGGGASYVKVQDVCKAGDTEACEKVKFTEIGSFTGSVVGGGVAGMYLGGGTAASICVGSGLVTAGTGLLVCGLVIVGVGAFGGGWLGGTGGDMAGEMIYKANK